MNLPLPHPPPPAPRTALAARPPARRAACPPAGLAAPRATPRSALATATRRAAAALLLALAAASAAAQPVASTPGALGGTRVPILAADGTTLDGWWFPAPGADGPRPAVLMLHGCGGLYRRDGTSLDARYPDYLARLHARGLHVLATDSFGPRGRREICTQRDAERTIDVARRRDDAIAAVAWLAQQPPVDARRIVALGWSHGAMTVLSAIDASRPTRAQPLAGAIVFYPGCSAVDARRYAPAVPLLMQLGARDDWTPPQRCERLVEAVRARQPGADLALTVHPDSYHGFDSTGPVRVRSDVQGGTRTVHAGGNPTARAAALAEMDRFLDRILQ